MPRFAANLSMMFQEWEMPARCEAVRAAGFDAVEYLRPYEFAVEDLRRWFDASGLEVVLINTPPGGAGVLPGRQAEFLSGIDRALEYATGLGARMVHCLAGAVPEGLDAAVAEQTFVENLREAAARAKATGIVLLLEALNTRDVPGYLHTTTAHSRRILEACGAGNVFLQYDLYHMQIMQGDLVEHLRRHYELVRHIQFSSVPGRHEPQFGEVNLPYVFGQIDALGYDGWLGCEYRPLNGTLEP
jgi:hydroxypyruvate isomerase